MGPERRSFTIHSRQVDVGGEPWTIMLDLQTEGVKPVRWAIVARNERMGHRRTIGTYALTEGAPSQITDAAVAYFRDATSVLPVSSAGAS